MNIQKGLMMLGCLGCLFLLTSCWDKIELEQEGFVVVLGLDKGPTPDLITVTYQIANPQAGSSSISEAPNEPPSDIVTISVPSVSSGKDTANTIAPRKINLSHLETIVIGQELAKSGQLYRVLSSSIRESELRRETNIIVTKENAADFIKNNKPRMETRPHKYYDFMIRRWKETGMVPLATLNRYFHRREITNTLFLTILATTEKSEPKLSGLEDGYTAGEIPEQNGDPAQLIGSAVLAGGKMIDTFTGEETRLTLLLRKKSQANAWTATYKDPLYPNFLITATAFKQKPTKVTFNVKKPIPVITVNVPIDMEITSIPSQINYVSDFNKQELLKQSIEKDLREKSMTLVKKCQVEYKDDPFLWSIDVKKNFLTEKDYEAYHWKDKFPEAVVQINYDIHFKGFGKQLEPAK